MTVWLTPAQIAQQHGKSRNRILEALKLKDGGLHGHQNGDRGRWRVCAESVDAWIASEAAFSLRESVAVCTAPPCVRARAAKVTDLRTRRAS